MRKAGIQQRLWRHLQHLGAACLWMGTLLVALAYWFSADVHYGDDPYRFKVGDEGPFVFSDPAAPGQYLLQYIRGEGPRGFYTEQQGFHDSDIQSACVAFPADQQEFTVPLTRLPASPPVRYQDDQPVLVLSDVESSFRSLRDFLKAQQVMDDALNWTFGRGHLVLLGDFVDRDASTFQLLWLIYRLEQQARAAGGQLHYILGNHELKNLQGNWQAADKKYQFVAAVLGRQPHELLGPHSFLGQWLASKNSIELINGHLFVHGGLHPRLAELPMAAAPDALEQLNQWLRARYRTAWYPKAEASPDASASAKSGTEALDFLDSTREGLAWYRGYFDGLTQAEVEAPLRVLGARAVVVGHTPQRQVQALYQGKVLAVNVRHPRDFQRSFPPRRSQGLLIEQGRYYRLLADGTREAL